MDMQMGEVGGTDAPKMCMDDGTRNKDNGLACSCDVQCKSGFCVDGVCCNKACTGTCMTCSLPSGPLGTCTTVPQGRQPRAASDCVAADKSTCGLDGMCDGAGHCERYPSGTICSGGSCDGDAVTGRYQCDGNGTCKLGASTVCAPFSCNPATNDCFDACTVDSDCVAGQTCQNGSCGLKMLAASCKADSECASRHCADGVCCNVACNTACRSCAMVGHVGTCSPTPADQPHHLCAVQAPSTCGTTGACDGFGSCSKFPAATVCGAATCSGNTLETAQTCDGLGTCQPSEAHECAPYRCANGACTSTCTVATTAVDCADNTACVNESCGPKPDGQSCKADTECMNNHCVDGVCCDSACTGACRSCSLSNSIGKCTDIAAGSPDPRQMCMDLGASTCGTNGKCDGNGGCQSYAVGTTCAGEDCTSDVYTGPSTCNASGQCIKPTSLPCNPYHCNANKCFTACTTNDQCITPNICGQNGNISSCGPKPRGAECSGDNECASTHCAQGRCCDKACTDACTACNLNGSVGTCSDVQNGADPQGICLAQPQASCGTTGMCAAGQCAHYSASTVCKAGSCEAGGPPSPALTPPSHCDGAGKCVTPSDQACAPGRCDTTALMCVNSCTTNADCTSPNTCVNGSCGLIQKGGTCSNTNQCASGLTCNHDKVCCDQACDGVCETCKPPGGTAGTCTAVGAGLPDPSAMCPITVQSTCGTNGKCTGNNSAAGTARCQDWDSSISCVSPACTNTGPGGSGVATSAAFCSGGSGIGGTSAGKCNSPTTQQCVQYKCGGTTCATTCTSDTDCIGTTCNTQTKHCGDKLGPGDTCSVSTDCGTSAPVCVSGVCCVSTCGAACNTGSCGSDGNCVNKSVGSVCTAASCSANMSTFTPAGTCSGTSGMCPNVTAGPCPNGFACTGGATPACLTSCSTDADCANGAGCNLTTHQCTGWMAGHACPATGGACGAGLGCVDGFCCSTACTGTCMACSMARTGQANGTCAAISMNGADSRCTSTTACGNDGTCNGSGQCKLVAAGTPSTCPPAACSNDMLTPASACDGMGACTTPTAAACPRNLSCASATQCNSTCTAPAAGCAMGFTMCNADGISCSP